MEDVSINISETIKLQIKSMYREGYAVSNIAKKIEGKNLAVLGIRLKPVQIHTLVLSELRDFRWEEKQCRNRY